MTLPLADDASGQPMVTNDYRCPADGTEWSAIWPGIHTSQCPNCRTECPPIRSSEL